MSQEPEKSWKDKFNSFMNTAQAELKKTTQIGSKMLDASQSNSQLHNKLESLGKMALEAMRTQSLVWKDEGVEKLVSEIEELEAKLNQLEEDVQKIKQSTPEEEDSPVEKTE